MNKFNEYKFVFVSENSVNDGYITEKIFNCYFSRTIPIYYGSNKINTFFNSDTFINMNNSDHDNIKELIIELSTNEDKYENFINRQIINNYDDENYKIKECDFINKIYEN